ncbi:RNA polymerase II associated 3 [Pyrrhoderma noxium]|uniref:RNA polymerase II associated 3 n=1 Tax=Pyrrhoderma noxium TaxID=2282107 RepID=A0A286U8Y6_9AGAM|nr:RNA polymerase II associated 3 [Pyrrhoderma noxium]
MKQRLAAILCTPDRLTITRNQQKEFYRILQRPTHAPLNYWLDDFKRSRDQGKIMQSVLDELKHQTTKLRKDIEHYKKRAAKSMQAAFTLGRASHVLGKFIMDDTLFPPERKDAVYDEGDLLPVYMHGKGTREDPCYFDEELPSDDDNDDNNEEMKDNKINEENKENIPDNEPPRALASNKDVQTLPAQEKKEYSWTSDSDKHRVAIMNHIWSLNVVNKLQDMEWSNMKNTSAKCAKNRLQDTIGGVAVRRALTNKDQFQELLKKRTVREEEEDSKIRSGKEREWDSRGSGIYGWQTEEEEDIWEGDLDYGGLEPDDCDSYSEMTVAELIEWRYIKAERAKEQIKETGNKAFRRGDYETAIKQYSTAYSIEPELPYYQLNIAAAYLKLSNWAEAEKACNVALSQQRGCKGYWRRAKARRMQGQIIEAVKDLWMVLKLQPGNEDALEELTFIIPTAVEQFTPPRSSDNSPERYDTQYFRSQDQSSGPSSRNNMSPSSGASGSGSTSTQTKTQNCLKEPLPFIPSEADKRRLRFVPLTLQLEFPITKKTGKTGTGSKSKDKTTALDVHISNMGTV